MLPGLQRGTEREDREGQEVPEAVGRKGLCNLCRQALPQLCWEGLHRGPQSLRDQVPETVLLKSPNFPPPAQGCMPDQPFHFPGTPRPPALSTELRAIVNSCPPRASCVTLGCPSPAPRMWLPSLFATARRGQVHRQRSEPLAHRHVHRRLQSTVTGPVQAGRGRGSCRPGPGRDAPAFLMWQVWGQQQGGASCP